MQEKSISKWGILYSVKLSIKHESSWVGKKTFSDKQGLQTTLYLSEEAMKIYFPKMSQQWKEVSGF